jgi:biotin carboxyl carrier protein
MLKKYDLKINGKEFEVKIEELGYTTAKVSVNGNTYNIEIAEDQDKDRTPKLVRSATLSPSVGVREPVTTKPDQLKKSNAVLSPMPGLIISIAVKTGDEVQAGDLILKMEAMKMENEIRSTCAGKIKTINVKPQEDVLEGDILVELE